MSFNSYCNLISENEFCSLFVLSKYDIPRAQRLFSFLTDEIKKTRFSFPSIQLSFETIASMNGITQLNNIWPIIEGHIGNFPTHDPDYMQIRSLLSHLSSTDVDKIIQTIRDLIQISRTTLRNNFISTCSSEQKQLGSIGELITFLCARDIMQSDCIFHKLVPDNPGMFRHGMDLLTVKFGRSTNEDIVCFWEAKATKNHFNDRRDEIINWFNQNATVTSIHMVIEAAKLDWAMRYEQNIFRRANSALTRFLYKKDNFRFIGSIIYDSSSAPSDLNIEKFDRINVNKTYKNFRIFNTYNMNELLNEVFVNLC